MRPDSTESKCCKSCGFERPLESFYRCRGYADGRSRTCIVCERAYKRRPDVMARARETATAAHGRKQARRRGLPATFTQAEWDHAKAYFGGCTYCGSTDGTLHMDHFIPEFWGGAFTADNIVPACASCNYRKHQRMPQDWCEPETYERVIAYFATLDLTPNGGRPIRGGVGYATGERHGSRTHPDSLPRGENHYMKQRPELIPRGEKRYNAKLTNEQAIEIIARHKAGGVSQRQLAREFGVSQTAISHIIVGRNWKNIPR